MISAKDKNQTVITKMHSEVQTHFRNKNLINKIQSEA